MLYSVFFSPAGTTRLVANTISASFGGTVERWDLLREADKEPPCLTAEDTLLLSMPVYAGLIPAHCVPLVQRLRGSSTPALLAAVYGNRDYDDALLQMQDLLEAQGFQVIAAGAFVAQHSIFPKTGAGRPDDRDLACIRNFGKECRELRDRPTVFGGKHLQVKGDPGYTARLDKPLSIPFHPTGSKSCVQCGACAAICPMGAIDPASPRETDREKCISCGACIAACPRHCRGYHSVAYPPAALAFQAKCSARRDPELFLLG